MLISYSVIYLVASFFPNIPWVGCDNWWNDEKCLRENSVDLLNNTVVNASSAMALTNKTFNSSIIYESASKQFFKYIQDFKDICFTCNLFNFFTF